MMEYTMMGGIGGFWNMSIWMLVYTALAAFIFGIIFWWTYTLVIPKSKKR